MLEKIKELRKELHKHPELSGEEFETPKRIKHFIEQEQQHQKIIHLNNTALVVICQFDNEGPVVMFRCELDALPIHEQNTFDHRSQVSGVSHKCGHDGHMAILAGLSCFLQDQSFTRGTLILLFQPAEETGKGAYQVVNDPLFKQLNPDYIFALHNIPGAPLNTIIAVQDSFSASVQSIAVQLIGKQCHASEPEKGFNPAKAIAEMINEFDKLNVPDQRRSDFAVITPIHIVMGRKAYGVSAGNAEVHYTFRTWTEEAMHELMNNIKKIVDEVSRTHSLQFTIEWCDYFPTAVNDNTCTTAIIKAAEINGFPLLLQEYPFKFGEDFGWFSKQYKTAMFGIGAGTHSPALHHADYDFPDAILHTGIQMFLSIAKQFLYTPD